MAFCNTAAPTEAPNTAHSNVHQLSRWLFPVELNFFFTSCPDLAQLSTSSSPVDRRSDAYADFLSNPGEVSLRVAVFASQVALANHRRVGLNVDMAMIGPL